MDLNGDMTEDRTSMDLNEAITEASTKLNAKLEKYPKQPSQHTIYRVHRNLRDVNCGAYEPEVVSIGPYHRGKDHLKMMEDHKLLRLHLLVEREGIDITKLAAAVGEVASKARQCYADQDFELSESEFIEMLVLDGCFIIEVLRTHAGWEGEADPIFKMDWMLCSLQRDLMLFENQVPFFVLRKLFNLIYPHSWLDRALVNLLFCFFDDLYPGGERSAEERELRASEIVARQDSQEIIHILDFIHRNWLPRESQKSEEEKSDNIKIEVPESQDSGEKKSDTDTKGEKEFEFMYCATRLTEASVKFEREKADTLFDIKFKDGTMVLPPLSIDDGTECLLRNLMAYEQYFKESPHDVVIQYMKLLDSLINSSKDMEILSGNGIITNWLGDDEAVANMVNRLGDSIVNDNSNYAKLYQEVNEHCRKPKNRWMAKLRRDYLNGPWAIISVVAAVVLLLLTVMQTVLSFLQVV